MRGGKQHDDIANSIRIKQHIFFIAMLITYINLPKYDQPI